MKYRCLLLWPAILFSVSAFSQYPNRVESILETVNITTRERTEVFRESLHFEAPNWSTDGKYFIVNSRGSLYKINADSADMEWIDTDFADDCNNDHGISPDGEWLAISHADKFDTTHTENWKRSTIYILPITGGKPQFITTRTPSFFHSWSPDGEMMAYCAERNGNFDIYTIPVRGGEEKRLTTTDGLDDGPDYSPDGRYIYFCSYRTGRMQLWRMKNDGADPEQLTDDAYANWFPHPSPDGKWVVFLSYMEDQQEEHPFGKSVKLRILNVRTKKIRDLTDVFYGGQGTLNVPSWSPDSKKVAFVRYKEKK